MNRFYSFGLALLFVLSLVVPTAFGETQPTLLKTSIKAGHAANLSDKCKDSSFTENENDYILGPNDVLRISVLGAPELNEERLRVQPNGTIILDVLDEPMNVEGMSMTKFYCTLTAAFDKFMYDPRLTIDLVESKPFLVYVTGAVLRPGSYEVSTQSTFNAGQDTPEVIINRRSALLSNVLVAAGGLSYNADLTNITIENKTTGKKQSIDLMALLTTGDSSQDLRLQKGDVVHVSRSKTLISEADYRLYASSSFSPKQVPVKVFGYVNNPGLVKLDTDQSLNLLSAITAAGGYISNAAYSPSKVYIYRPVDEEGHLVRMGINPKTNDVTLFPNDIVYVPLNKPARAGLFFDYLARIMTPAARAAQTYRGFTGDTFF